jgi:hypothetical protein
VNTMLSSVVLVPRALWTSTLPSTLSHTGTIEAPFTSFHEGAVPYLQMV